MSSTTIRGGDGNRYPALVTSDGKLMVDTEMTVSGINIENVNVFRDELGNLSHGLVSSTSFHQKDDIYDSAGNSLTSTGGALDVSVTAPDGIGITYQVPVIISGTQNALPVTDNNTTLSIDDGSGSITVDGTVSIGHPVVISGTLNNLAVNLNDGSGNALSSTGGKLDVDTEITIAGVSVNSSVPVIISGTQNALAVTDNSGSLTVDGTVSIGHPIAISGTQTVTATDLDIRDLNYNQDSVSVAVGHPVIVSGLTVTDGKLEVDTEIEIPEGIAVNAVIPIIISGTQNALPVTDNNTTLSVDDGAGSLTVDGTVSIGHPVVISGTVTVDATDLDIRDLDYNQDSVSVAIGHPIVISGTLNALATNATLQAGTAIAGKVYLTDGTDDANIDSDHNALITMNYTDNLAHNGESFRYGFVDTAIDDAATMEFIFATPATKTVFAAFNAAAGGDGLARLWETPTISTSGVMVTPTCLNRNVLNVPESRCWESPTVTASGTTNLCTVLVPAGTKKESSGAESALANHWVLAAGTNYMFVLTNIAGAAQPGGLGVEFYEE